MPRYGAGCTSTCARDNLRTSRAHRVSRHDTSGSSDAACSKVTNGTAERHRAQRYRRVSERREAFRDTSEFLTERRQQLILITAMTPISRHNREPLPERQKLTA